MSHSAQRFLRALARVCNRFRPRRHLLNASECRTRLQERLAAWREAETLVRA